MPSLYRLSSEYSPSTCQERLQHLRRTLTSHRNMRRTVCKDVQIARGEERTFMTWDFSLTQWFTFDDEQFDFESRSLGTDIARTNYVGTETAFIEKIAVVKLRRSTNDELVRVGFHCDDDVEKDDFMPGICRHSDLIFIDVTRPFVTDAMHRDKILRYAPTIDAYYGCLLYTSDAADE